MSRSLKVLILFICIGIFPLPAIAGEQPGNGQLTEPVVLFKPNLGISIGIVTVLRSDHYFDQDTVRLSHYLFGCLLEDGWRMSALTKTDITVIIGALPPHRRYKEKSDLGAKIEWRHMNKNSFISFRPGWAKKIIKKIEQ